MANIYDGASSGTPMAAPRRLGMGPVGRLRAQFHPRVLASLHPDHPIFKVIPGLREALAQAQGGPLPGGQPPTVPPGQFPPDPSAPPPPPIGPTASNEGGWTAPSGPPPGFDTHGIGAPTPSRSNNRRSLDPAYDDTGGGAMHQVPLSEPSTQDPQGPDMNQQGPGTSQQDGGPNMEEDLRQLLLQRFHTAAPQQPALTSRAALNRFLQQRGGQARKPMLPLRRPAGGRPY